MTMRTALARVRGLGSAKEGVSHWWAQRLTALALIPLTLWFAVSIIGLAAGDHAAVVAWVGHPAVAVLLIALIIAAFYHSQLGVQVVIEDYVHTEWLKLTGLLLLNFAAILLAMIGVFAVLRIALGA